MNARVCVRHHSPSFFPQAFLDYDTISTKTMVGISVLPALAVTLLTPASAMTRGERRIKERRLDFERFGLGYEPSSQVTDHAAIDLDQASIEKAVALRDFESAKAIYRSGGHSESFASITLNKPLTANIVKGAPIRGVDDHGHPVNGKAYADSAVGDTTIQFRYQTLEIQDSYVDCQVGALYLIGEENTRGCLAPSGRITVEETDGITFEDEEYTYEYNVLIDNLSGRMIAGFSTTAQTTMFDGCPGCPYSVYQKFYDYYGVFDYANEWVASALDGRQTSFRNGNADFSMYSFTGRGEAATKGTVYMNILMQVLRGFNEAIDDCRSGCLDCNDERVNAWDAGVAFYTGSTESRLLYNLANEMCRDFRTCGPEGIGTEGTAKLNYDLFREFSGGQFNLMRGDCNAAANNTRRATELVFLPFVQGVLQNAYRVNYFHFGKSILSEEDERSRSRGAVFAAALLPVLHGCSPEAARIVYDNMRVGAQSTDYMAVRSALQSTYACMNITCADVGALFNEPMFEYHQYAEVCDDDAIVAASGPAGGGFNTMLNYIAGRNVVVVAVIVIVVTILIKAMNKVVYKMNRDKTRKPGLMDYKPLPSAPDIEMTEIIE